jgi:hypothetical protein
MRAIINVAEMKQQCIGGSPLRYKTTFGAQMQARKIENQQTEVLIKTKILNIQRDVGMPMSYRVA